jgi:hypothetical protein
MTRARVEAALRALKDLKAEQWESMFPSFNKWLQEKE